MKLPPFHLAFPVHDLAAARAFYGDLLGCAEGRSDARWIDYDFFGHQIVAHLVPPSPSGEGTGVGPVNAEVTSPTLSDPHAGRSPLKGRGYSLSNPVDGHDVPIPHFGAVLPMEEWRALADRLKAADTEFVMEPTIRFEGQPGEQATMFFRDPSGNALEMKAMADPAKLFAK